ncbi:hypothetical protein [Paraburkholderia youngii]|uniref:hypothetical protein n=1 Tax=Paraburkholderia youngii TaxID=2782701 RepID=UPI003D257BA2
MVHHHSEVPAEEEEWIVESDGGIEIHARRAKGEPWTVAWMGRADSSALVEFMFSIDAGAPIKATAWKAHQMIEVDGVSSPKDLHQQLTRENASLDKDARFIRFESAPLPGRRQDSNAPITVWSKQGPVRLDESIDDGANGVGLYIGRSVLSHAIKQVAAFIRATYAGSESRPGSVEKVLGKVVGKLAAA